MTPLETRLLTTLKGIVYVLKSIALRPESKFSDKVELDAAKLLTKTLANELEKVIAEVKKETQ